MRAEYDAFRARVESAPILTGRVHSAVRFDTAGDPVRDNYVVAFPGRPRLIDDARYTTRQTPESSAKFRFDVRYVAVDVDGVLLFAEAAHDRLIGHVLVVPGRRCDAISLVPSVEEEQVRFDKTARLFYLDETYEFWSRRP